MEQQIRSRLILLNRINHDRVIGRALAWVLGKILMTLRVLREVV